MGLCADPADGYFAVFSAALGGRDGTGVSAGTTDE